MIRSSREVETTALRFASWSLGLVLLALAGCATVGPDYRRPDVDTGSGWSEVGNDAAESEPESGIEIVPEAGQDFFEPITAAELGAWWRRFDDPTLDRLIAAALASNLDLRIAAARVEASRAARDHVFGRRLPSAEARGSVTESRLSRNGSLPIDRIPGFERDQTILDVGVSASWEADLFGGTRRAVQAAEARLGGARYERRAVQSAVVAELARLYVGLRGEQRRLARLEAASGALRRTRELVVQRVEMGESARVELLHVEAELRARQARLVELHAGTRDLALAIGPLVGGLPEDELSLLDEVPSPLQLAPFPLGERSELLARRPDVAAAERRLAAATAEIGVATAELYPRLRIGARGGFQALDDEPLLDAASATWSLVPSISWRIFDGGRVRAEIRLAEARAEQAALAFESAVVGALADAERSLTRYRGSLAAVERQREAVELAAESRDLEKVRHRSGESSLLPLLDAERRLDEQEAELEASSLRAATELVTLIQALGGGWSASERALSPTSDPSNGRLGD